MILSVCRHGLELYRTGDRGHADSGRNDQDVGPDREGNDGAVVSSKATDLMV